MLKPKVRAGIKLGALLIVTTGLLIPYLVFYPLGRQPRRFFAYPFFKFCNLCAGLKIQVKGNLEKKSRKFYVSNHVSYLDIPVLASLIDGLFVAKSDVARWPVIGFLAKISKTHFVSRKATNIPKERQRISSRIEKGDSIFLFPEGSSGNGQDILPFKPGLLSTALIAPRTLNLEVQPVTIIYGAEVDQEKRDRYAWYGDKSLAPHVWELLGLKERLTVTVIFHETLPCKKFDCRKELATWAQETVETGLYRELNFNETQSMAS